MEGLQDLIRHLGENPGDRDVATLASRFGLDEQTVSLAIGRAAGSGLTAKQPRPSLRPALGARLDRALSRAAASPARSVASICGCVAILLSLSLSLALQDPEASRRGGGFVAAALLLSIPVVAAVLFRAGSVRHALWASAGLAAAVAVPLGTFVATGDRVGPAVVMFVVATVLATALFVPVASLGAYVAVRHDERAYQEMDRHQALVRLLELRRLLAETPVEGRSPEQADRLRQGIWVFAPAAALLLRVANDVILARMDPGRTLLAGQPPGVGAGPVLVLLAFQMASPSLMFLAGYMSRKVPAGVAVAVLMELMGWLAAALPTAYAPLSRYLESGPATIAGSFVIPVVAGAAGGMAGRAHEHFRTRALRDSNDREVLTAEMIDLEWRLRPGARHVCAMVVDVAGSTKMKAGADPLVVEMCFREYQNWVGGVAVEHGGEVTSRAGDGAVLAFEREDDAIAAALAIQSGLAAFNAERNRLESPFRLRIGIHCGEVAGGLAEVEYTGVIDGAAHVESVAPIGGVALTEAAARKAQGWNFSPIGQEFEGHQVLVVLGPAPGRNTEPGRDV